MTAPLHPGAQPANPAPDRRDHLQLSALLLRRAPGDLHGRVDPHGHRHPGGHRGALRGYGDGGRRHRWIDRLHLGLGIGLLFAAGVVALAIFNNRGKNPSRIVTWVAAGLTLCCTGLGLLATAAGGAISGVETGDPNLPTQAELQERIEAALPGWYEPASLAIGILGMLAMLAAAILLALPAANEFFRKPPAMWEPPLPGTVPDTRWAGSTRATRRRAQGSTRASLSSTRPSRPRIPRPPRIRQIPPTPRIRRIRRRRPADVVATTTDPPASRFFDVPTGRIGRGVSGPGRARGAAGASRRGHPRGGRAGALALGGGVRDRRAASSCPASSTATGTRGGAAGATAAEIDT